MRLLTVLSLFVLSVCPFVRGEPPPQCTQCLKSKTCNPPECFCCREDLGIPSLTRLSEIPQIVFFTFDDAVTDQVAGFYYQLFDSSRKNPNGCSISMTLFISHDNTKYRLVSDFYQRGMEIASHSVTHSTMNGSNFFEEAKAQKENLAKLADIPVSEITGWRSPFLKPTGDLQPDALKKLGYDYDATLTFSKRSFREKPPGPFTLDFGFPYECQVKPCPKHKHPGFWEVPVVSLMDYMQKYDCVYVDGCMNAPPDEEAAYKFLWENFQTYYTQTRMPFGINMHPSWFFYPDRLRAMDRFIQKLVSMNDVYIVSANRMLEWLKNPTPLQDLHSFAPWACDGREKTYKSGPTLVKTNLPPPPVSWIPRRIGSITDARRMLVNGQSPSPVDRNILLTNSRMDGMRTPSVPQTSGIEVKPTILFQPTNNLSPSVPNTQFENQQQTFRINRMPTEGWSTSGNQNAENSADVSSLRGRLSMPSLREQESRRKMLEQHERLLQQQKLLEEARLQKEELLRKQQEQEQLRRQQELLERQQTMLREQQKQELLRQQQLQQQRIQQQQQQQFHRQQQQHQQQVNPQQSQQPASVIQVQFLNEHNINRNPQNLRAIHRELLEQQQQAILLQQQKSQELERQRLLEDLPASIDSQRSQSDINARHRDLLVLQQSLQDKSLEPDQPVRPENMIKQKTVVWEPPETVENVSAGQHSSPASSTRNRFQQQTIQLWPQTNVFGTRPVSSAERSNDPTSARFNERQSSATNNVRSDSETMRRTDEQSMTRNIASVNSDNNNNAMMPIRFTDSPRHLWYSDFTANFGPMNNGPRFSRGGSNRRPGFGPATVSPPRSPSRQHTLIPQIRPDPAITSSRRQINRNMPFQRSSSPNDFDRQQLGNGAQAVTFRERTVTENQGPRIPFSSRIVHPSVTQQIAWNSFIRNMLGQH